MAFMAKPSLPNFVISLEHLPYEGLNILQIIEQEHRFVESLFECYKNAQSLLDKQEIAFHTIRALICHSICEETTFYPTLRWKFPDGNKEADSLISEHLHLRQTLARLDAMDPTDPEFDLEYQRVVLETIAHTREHEEKTILPRFRKFFNDKELLDMAGHWRECLQSVHHHHREQQARKAASKSQEMNEPIKSMPAAHVDKNEHLSHHDMPQRRNEKDEFVLEPAVPMQEPLKSMPGAHIDKNEHMTHHFDQGMSQGVNKQSNMEFASDKGRMFAAEPQTSKQSEYEASSSTSEERKSSKRKAHVINIS